MNRMNRSAVFTAVVLCMSFLGIAPAIYLEGNVGQPGQRTDPDFCGNKHKNLVRLQGIVAGTPNVVIPAFIGIPTRRIEAFLRQHASQIFTDYARAIGLLPTALNNPAELSAVESILHGIQETIKTCFNIASFSFTADELALFSAAAAQQKFFMVRSTGVEDGAVANAGGNASIAYVNPIPQAIAQATGEVIASYFGVHSLKNRIGAGEQLSANDLCLPVLIQLLIGETVGGAVDVKDIPVSGVAYTTNQSISSPNFAITEINAAYGHGEGVVANRVIADRYYVTPSRVTTSPAQADVSIYPMLYHKQERLVSHRDEQANKYTLVAHKNSEALAHASALSHDQVKQLYTVLKKIEAAYGQPMDVEFVVLDTTIYIVQARPAMHVPMQPSYVAFDKIAQTDISDPIQGTSIVPGKAQVLVITNPQDIIVTNTLDEADQMPNSTRCKAVIVDSWASSLSHAAVNFKTYGTPCMMVDNLSAVKSLIAQITPQFPLIFDIQQRTLVLWKNGQKNVNDFIVQGWLEHPIEATYSIWNDRMVQLALIANPLPQDGKVRVVLEGLKKVHQYEQKQAQLKALAERVTNHIALTQKRLDHVGTAAEQDFINKFAKYKQALDQLLKEFDAGITQKVDQFELLFYHKMLEALLYQSADTNKVLDGFNYTHFLNELYEKQAVFKAKKQLGTTDLLFAAYF